MARITSFKVLNATLSINGLAIKYLSNGYANIKMYDPCSLCHLLQEAGFIEGFETDQNHEPVILHTHVHNQRSYGYELWFNFIKTFPFNNRVAEMLLEHEQDTKLFRKQQAKIAFLLQPLTAA